MYIESKYKSKLAFRTIQYGEFWYVNWWQKINYWEYPYDRQCLNAHVVKNERFYICFNVFILIGIIGAG